MSSGPPYERKTFFHSDFVAATQDGPLRVYFNQAPQPSKYPGNDPWCGMKVQPPAGREQEFPLPEYTLNVENENVGALVAQNHGQWLDVRAYGQRDAATLVIENRPDAQNGDQAGAAEGSSPSPSATAPSQSQAQPERSAPQQSKSDARPKRTFEKSMRRALWVAQQTTDDFFAEFGYDEDGLTPKDQLEFVRLIAQSLFIQFHGQFKYQYVEMGGLYGPFRIAEKRENNESNGEKLTGSDGGDIAEAKDVAEIETLLGEKNVPPEVETGIRREIETGEMTQAAARMAIDVLRAMPSPGEWADPTAPDDDLPF